MQAYRVEFTVLGKNPYKHSMLVDARNRKSAKSKIEKRMGRKIHIDFISVIGYY